MNEQESVDVESAYSSHISTNSEALIKRDTFTIEDSPSRNRIHWKWLKHKFRDYMVLETVFFLILVFLLITCYRISSQNEETHRMILSIQSELKSFQKPVDKVVVNMKEETEKVYLEKTKAMLEEDLKDVQRNLVLELEQSQTIINSTSKREKTHVRPIIPIVPSNSTLKKFNAASLIANATIDTSLSSSSSLNPIFGFDQSSLVLVDRPEPPANKAWCTSDKSPVLTVNLAKYINPTAVSYQHSKWNEIIPDDAPKEYSVEVCLDNYCVTRKPLFSHCEYNQHGLQEQICNNTSNDSINSPVAKLQFHFHKNHGNTERTCVSLVRVYSGTEVLPEQKLRRLEDTTTCIDLSRHYHNNPNIYKYYTFKNCALLYSKGCCQECPECCEKCDIKDMNPDIINTIIGCVTGFIFFSFLIFVVGLAMYMDLNRVARR